MTDMYQNVAGQVDPFKRLASYVPGFHGYVERQNRRDADKLVRDTVARRFTELWTRTSNLQKDLISAKKIDFVDDMEQAALQLRTFIDKVTTAARGYSGLFDAVKINEKELEQLYTFDLAFFELGDQIAHALDNVEASLGDDAGLPAAIRNLTTLGRQAVETINRRTEAFTGNAR
ncbi:MAG TPA: hypothetical protein VMJ64_12090 [Anaerolineales bacterium]|nr:hypothetical protein [Anaerolineales bacterium]